MAVDFGTKRIGIAVCDELQITTHPLSTLESRGIKRDARTIYALAVSVGAQLIIIGLPQTPNRSHSQIALKALKLAEKIRQLGTIEVITWNEHLTSQEALSYLKGRKRNQSTKGRIDQIAACIILDDYLLSQQKQPLSDVDQSGSDSLTKAITSR